MKLLLLSLAAGLHLPARHTFLTKADPLCRSGIVSSDMFACCPKSCGACDDANPACTGAGGDKAFMEKGGCCPTPLKEGTRLCDNVSPPCKLGDDYRNPPNADALDILANTERHAKDDCGEAKGVVQKDLRVATHFVHKIGIKVNTPGSDCGTYAEIDAAAEACRVKDDCVGFSLKGGKPDCLLNDFGLTDKDPESEVYLKVKNQAGKNLVDGQRRFVDGSDQEVAVEDAQAAADAADDKAMLTDKLVDSAPEKQKEAAQEQADAAAGAAEEAKAAAAKAEAAPDASAAVGAEEEAASAMAEASAAANTVAADQGRHFCDDHDPREFPCCQARDRGDQSACLQEEHYYYYEAWMGAGGCYYYIEGGSPDPDR